MFSLLVLGLMAAAPPQAENSGPEPLMTPNLYREPPGCESIPRQVAGEDRRYEGTRLDQLPPGKLLYAVDRQVDGCRVVTFVAEERRRQRR